LDVSTVRNQLTNDVMVAQTTPQNVEPKSSSDQDGPIWGYHFVPNQPARSITSEAAVEFLTAPGPAAPDEFVWLHFSLSNAGSEPWLRRYVTLPDTFYDSLHSDVDATHLEQDADSLVARVHDVLFDFTFDAPVATTSLCVKPRVLVSAHARPWRSIDQLRAAVQGGQVFHSPIEIWRVFYAIKQVCWLTLCGNLKSGWDQWKSNCWPSAFLSVAAN
jgi:zinc transporter